MGQILNALSPNEAGAAVIPKDAESRQMLDQMRWNRDTPYGTGLTMIDDDPTRAVDMYHMNPRAQAALGPAFLQQYPYLYGAITNAGLDKSSMYITPLTSQSVYGGDNQYHKFGQDFYGGAPPIEQVVAHEAGHGLTIPVVDWLDTEAKRPEYKELDKEMLADLAAMNPTTEELRNQVSKWDVTEYADVLHGALGPNARVLEVAETYDTPLMPDEAESYKSWLDRANKVLGRDVSRDTEDYDMQGFWKDNPTAPLSKGMHFPDTYKKPNHPTFSNESRYYFGNESKAGHWEGEKFIPPIAKREKPKSKSKSTEK